jgi:hypothetical protein
MILTRPHRHYFAKKFDTIIRKYEAERVNALADAERPTTIWPNRIATFLRHGGADLSVVAEANEATGNIEKKQKKQGIIRKLRPDMIRRMDDAPRLINPSGFAVPLKNSSTVHSNGHSVATAHLSFAAKPSWNEDNKPARRSSIGYDASDRK